MSAYIIDCGSGNLHSVKKAFEHAASMPVHITTNASDLDKASHIILPGVGAFGDCMQGLSALDGMIDTLREHVLHRQKPFLGICVGLQMLAEKGFEHGEHQGLGWVKGKVVAITPANTQLKIPHMGWNNLYINQENHPILNGIKSGDHAYFVHSFQFTCEEKDAILLTVEYGEPVTAAIAKDNIFATQFHPEKSQRTGLTFIKNFLAI